MITAPELEAAVTVPTPQRSNLGRFMRRPVVVASLSWLVLIALACAFAPVIAPHNPLAQNLGDNFAGPSFRYPLGTDDFGRDILSRILYGGGGLLAVSLLPVLVSFSIGVSAGLLVGFVGGFGDIASGFIVDMMLSIPALVIILAVGIATNENLAALAISFGILLSAPIFRLVQAITRASRGLLYVDAARVAGLTRRRIIFRHILPNVAGPLVVQAVLFYSASFLFLTSLSFLGLGFSPDSPSWGQLVNDATQHLNQDPWMMVPIGAVLIFTILALNLLAAAIVEALPTTQRGVALAARAPRAVPVALAPDKARLSSPRTPSTLTAVSKDALLVIDDLTVSVPGPDHDPTNLVEGITMAVERGETVGIVGESGCGKTMTALAVLGLVPAPASVTGGRVLFNGVDVSNMSERDRTELRGKMIGLVSQEPMSALDPCFTVGSQLAEPLRLHRHLSRKSARSEAVELLATVGIHRPEVVASSYPHELSGGMAQRVAIAIALCGQPDLLIADEPTSAVDVTVQAELLDLLRELQDRYGMTLLLVTHDFGVVADICRRVVVMYAGQIVEDGPIDLVLNHQSHPYTKGLIGSIPDPTYAGRHLDVLPGSVMTPGEWPAGCHFAPRCRYALAECTTGPIPLLSIENRHECRCVRGREIMDAIAP